MYRQGGGGVRLGRGRGGRARDKEEAGQKFSVMSMEEGTGRRCVEERLFSGRWRGWEGVRTYFCQFKERHLSKGATRVSACVRVHVCD